VKSLNASVNISQFAVIDSIIPDNSGTITIKCNAGPNNTTNEKFFYIGAMKITVIDSRTGLNVPSAVTINAFYSNGILKIKDYSGRIQITDFSGKILFNGRSENGQSKISLKQGVYILSTNTGNEKLVVY